MVKFVDVGSLHVLELLEPLHIERTLQVGGGPAVLKLGLASIIGEVVARWFSSGLEVVGFGVGEDEGGGLEVVGVEVGLVGLRVDFVRDCSFVHHFNNKSYSVWVELSNCNISSILPSDPFLNVETSCYY